MSKKYRKQNRDVLLEEVSAPVVFIVVEAMPDGTGALHSLHWKRENNKENGQAHCALHIQKAYCREPKLELTSK